MSKPATLLMLNAFIGTAGYKRLYQELGYTVVAEWSERKAISLVRKTPPDVIVADFYHKTDFRDRLSNLESLLAAVHLGIFCSHTGFGRFCPRPAVSSWPLRSGAELVGNTLGRLWFVAANAAVSSLEACHDTSCRNQLGKQRRFAQSQ